MMRGTHEESPPPHHPTLRDECTHGPASRDGRSLLGLDHGERVVVACVGQQSVQMKYACRSSVCCVACAFLTTMVGGFMASGDECPFTYTLPGDIASATTLPRRR
eukprot:scaffold9603_cov65-Phaeocystis_antarctica.AAC.4